MDGGSFAVGSPCASPALPSIRQPGWLIPLTLAVLLHAAALLLWGNPAEPTDGADDYGSGGIESGIGLAGSYVPQRAAAAPPESAAKEPQPVEAVSKNTPPKPVVKQTVSKPPPRLKAPVVQTDRSALMSPQPLAATVIAQPVPQAEPESEPKPEPVVSRPAPTATPQAAVDRPVEVPAKASTDRAIEQRSDDAQTVASIPATGSGNSLSQGGDPAVAASYYGRVRALLSRNKRFPRSARKAGISGTVTLSFTIDARGRLGDLQLVNSSGHAVLDQAAVDLLERSSPFPRPPSTLHPPLSLSLPIEYSLSD